MPFIVSNSPGPVDDVVYHVFGPNSNARINIITLRFSIRAHLVAPPAFARTERPPVTSSLPLFNFLHAGRVTMHPKRKPNKRLSRCVSVRYLECVCYSPSRRINSSAVMPKVPKIKLPSCAECSRHCDDNPLDSFTPYRFERRCPKRQVRRR